jgi:hypothetical protein
MSTTSLLAVAESWEKVYKAFQSINFTAYDYNAVKQSLIDYLKLQYPENFNDYIESSQLIALVETFAYVAELLAYRVDLSVHESMMPTATRKQSILRLAKLISYSSSRNLPLRGLVKINSISISENFTDSQGNSLSNRVINWNDQNNTLWREQFFTAIDKVMTQSYGNPYKSFQIDNTIFQQYEIRNVLETESIGSAFQNGVLKTSTTVNGTSLPFELVSADLDQSGVFERSPNPNAYFSFIYGDDGFGDASDTTGFMMFTKQGVLQKLPFIFDINLPNRTLDVNIPNINDSDVWIQQVDSRGIIQSNWEQVPNVAGVNLIFNNVQTMNKYEVETLENDQIRIIFGDGDFAAMPTGIFNIWVRSSTSGGLTVPKTLISNQAVTFSYTSRTGTVESCTLTYSLVGALQNSAPTESVSHIKNVAPSVYYTQDRMVNGQDYNSYLLQDPTILRLNAINRTFAGQPKYINWNDASGSYQNVKIFGNDLRIYYDIGSLTQSSTISERSLIDDVIEPELSIAGISNLLIYATYKTPLQLTYTAPSGPVTIDVHPYFRPRTKFIEDVTQLINNITIQEKTEIQGIIDRHWYGEAQTTVQLDSNLSDVSSNPKSIYYVVNNDTDQRIWPSTVKCVVQDSTTGLYSLISTPNGTSGIQETVIRDRRFAITYTPTRPFASTLQIGDPGTLDSGFPTSNVLAYTDVNQTLATEDVYTIEFTDKVGSFTVHSSTHGNRTAGKIGTNYTDGIFSFIIGPSTAVSVPGDAFVVSINLDNTGHYVPNVLTTNLTGRFNVIDSTVLTGNAEQLEYNPADPVASWIFIITRTDDVNANTLYWTMTRRDFSLVMESSTTKFWYNQNMTIIDPTTQLPVVDMIRLLKSNLNAARSAAIGTDHIYNIVADVKYKNGEVNFNALEVAPADSHLNITTAVSGTATDSLQFLSFVGDNDYVYFSIDSRTGNYIPVNSTTYLSSLTYTNNVSSDGLYARRIGRDNLDFLWQHFTPLDNLIDPSPSNIIDVYVLTSGYYSQILEYVNGVMVTEPKPPSSLELRNTYRSLLQNKMISDSVIMHSGSVKLLFGSLAIPELRTKFKVVLSPSATLTGDQVRASVLATINSYFTIDNWDFGQSFYATELCAVIHQKLFSEISSVVMVPEFPTNYFGDLFFLRSSPNEVFISCATIDNIEIITSIDRMTMKQK